MALVTLLVVAAGCGGAGENGSSTSDSSSSEPDDSGTNYSMDEEWIAAYLNRAHADFPRFEIERIEFAKDSQGNDWALAETYSYRVPDQGLFEAYVFQKTGGRWEEVAAGSSGYSQGVPPEVQKEWGIEGI
jgi:hypothetical protein